MDDEKLEVVETTDWDNNEVPEEFVGGNKSVPVKEETHE